MSASPLSALPLPAHDPIWGLCGPFLALLFVVRAIAYRYRVSAAQIGRRTALGNSGAILDTTMIYVHGPRFEQPPKALMYDLSIVLGS